MSKKLETSIEETKSSSGASQIQKDIDEMHEVLRKWRRSRTEKVHILWKNTQIKSEHKKFSRVLLT